MYKAIVNEKAMEIAFDKDKITIDENSFDWDIVEIGKQSFHIIHKDKSYRAEVLAFDKEAKTVTLRINGNKYTVEVKDKLDLLLERLGMDKLASNEIKDIKAPMPGLVLDILIKEGDEVKKGDQIMILEAMKMENVLKSPGDGIVKTIKVKKGDGVDKNQVMILF
ncbi:biotin/lipoyl-binding protein [Fulvivirga sp. RKSG066]|uniref:acetyl-CoA carboxylase biotin carboxyl carrier protein subunit n=1 Tax=Fulvivirga aurantia TaxID=2529383 RepID=UPI0012BBF775|nr:acetyl-CoA carboxylase biotin carboxyl carrier protein subunit [Fulvivirga aurantia]MTI21997.1 biotin/lipoyl-binding protein [Fulvivirga aurantia]